MKQLKSGNFTEGRGDVFQIYPHSVNHFVRELLRGEPHPNQENILDFASDWYNKLEHRLFSDRGIPKDVMYRSCYAAYLLGRISEKDLIVKAKDIIRNCIGDLDSKISHDTESQKNRSLLLLIRSFCISSIILGDKKCSGEYIEKMLDNPTWDDINRGFHLEYYGDLPYRYGAKYSVEMTDSNLEDFSNTFSMLSGRVSKDLKKKRPENNLFEVEVYTLASLAVNRQLNGVLDADIRSKLSRMVGEIQKKDADYIHCRRLSEYLLFAEKILREEKYGANSVLFFLYRLKSQKRIGWKKRNISEPESVADHTWGCMLLAALYLPEDTEEDKESKRNIMNMLAIHDLAESELGDIPTPQKKEDDSRKENEWMQSMLSASGQWSYSNPGYFYRLWAKFKTARSGGAREDDARVAFEIDKLENLVQLEVYHEKFPGKITDYKKWKNDLIREIQTEKGKKIRDVILKGKLIRDVGK